MPYSPIKVANEFLRLAREASVSVTPLKLIKLVYIANGWSFVHFPESPLVNEQAQAWQYGPVMPSLYHSVKEYRSSPITSSIPGDSDPQELSQNAIDLIFAVFEIYGKLSGIQLSELTHQPGTPWSVTWNHAGKNALIPNDLVRDHYQAMSKAA